MEEECAAAMPAPKGGGEEGCETQPTLHTTKEKSTNDEDEKEGSRNFARTREQKEKKRFGFQWTHAEGLHEKAGEEQSYGRRSEPRAVGNADDEKASRTRSNSGESGGSMTRTDDKRGGGRTSGPRWWRMGERTMRK